MAEYKEYTVNIGSSNPIYFKSAYTGGQATARFNGTVVITTQSEGFGDAGNATSATAQMVSSDFGSALYAELTELYGEDATANPENYEVDKSALISRSQNYTVKNGYTILNISYMNVEIEAEAQQNDNADVEILAPTEGGNTTENDPTESVVPIAAPEPAAKNESMAVPIIVISLSIVVVIAAVVSAIVLVRKKGKSSAENNAAPTTEKPVEKPAEEAIEKPAEKPAEEATEETEEKSE